MQNVSLIPEGSILTEAVVDAYMLCHPDLNEETAITGLNTFLDGQGELPACMNGKEVFYPLMQEYWVKSGHEGEMPEDWKKPLVEVPEKSPEEATPTT
jgi:hypothetical protein